MEFRPAPAGQPELLHRHGGGVERHHRQENLLEDLLLKGGGLAPGRPTGDYCSFLLLSPHVHCPPEGVGDAFLFVHQRVFLVWCFHGFLCSAAASGVGSWTRPDQERLRTGTFRCRVASPESQLFHGAHRRSHYSACHFIRRPVEQVGLTEGRSGTQSCTACSKNGRSRAKRLPSEKGIVFRMSSSSRPSD